MDKEEKTCTPQWNVQELEELSNSLPKLDTWLRHKTTVDLRIICGNRTFDAHCFILAANSPLLNSLLWTHGMHHREIFHVLKIDDIKPKVLEDLLIYMYSRQVHRVSVANTSEVLAVISAAQTLQISKGEEYFTLRLLDHDDSSLPVVWRWAKENRSVAVKRVVANYIGNHLEELLKEGRLLKLSRDCIRRILSHPQVRSSSQTAVEIILAWVKYDKRRHPLLPVLFRGTQFCSLPNCYKMCMQTETPRPGKVLSKSLTTMPTDLKRPTTTGSKSTPNMIFPILKNTNPIRLPHKFSGKEIFPLTDTASSRDTIPFTTTTDPKTSSSKPTLPPASMAPNSHPTPSIVDIPKLPLGVKQDCGDGSESFPRSINSSLSCFGLSEGISEFDLNAPVTTIDSKSGESDIEYEVVSCGTTVPHSSTRSTLPSNALRKPCSPRNLPSSFNPNFTGRQQQWPLTTESFPTVNSYLRTALVVMGKSQNNCRSVHYVLPESEEWVCNLDLPIAMEEGESMARLDNDLYIVGGRDVNNKLLNDVYKYNSRQQVLCSMPPLKVARSEAKIVCQGSNLFVIGGESSSGQMMEADCLDLGTGIWKPLPPFEVPRKDPGIAITGEFIYLIGGGTIRCEKLVSNIASWVMTPPLPAVFEKQPIVATAVDRHRLVAINRKRPSNVAIVNLNATGWWEMVQTRGNIPEEVVSVGMNGTDLWALDKRCIVRLDLLNFQWKQEIELPEILLKPSHLLGSVI